MATIIAVAMAFTAGCEEVESTFDAQLQEAISDLEDELEGEGTPLAVDPVTTGEDRPEGVGVETVREDGLTRRQIVRALRSLADRERCDIGGIIAGRFRGEDSGSEDDPDIEPVDSDLADGGFRLRGYNFNGDRIAVARGNFWDDRRGGDFHGQYETRAGALGLLGGEYLASGVVFDDLGAFVGDWSSIHQDMVQFEGNIAGVWHPLPNHNGGLIVGYWSDCDEEHTEPMPSPM